MISPISAKSPAWGWAGAHFIVYTSRMPKMCMAAWARPVYTAGALLPSLPLQPQPHLHAWVSKCPRRYKIALALHPFPKHPLAQPTQTRVAG